MRFTLAVLFSFLFLYAQSVFPPPSTGGSIASTASVLKGDGSGGAVAATSNTDFAAAAHASRHQNGGADEVATATPGANAIPKAGAGGTLNSSWIPTLNQNTSGSAASLLTPGLYGLTPFTSPPTSSWTWDNQDAATEDVSSGTSIYLNLPQENSALRMRYRSAPSTPYIITGIFYSDFAGIAADGNALDFGFRDSGGKYVTIHVSSNNNIYVLKWNSATSASTAYVTLASTLWTSNPKHLRITDNGTNLIFEYRLTPLDNWVVLTTQARGDFLSTGPNAVAWGGYVNGGVTRASLASWLQQ